ncbi:uncharacterized protein EKO05_0010024 [Ascochyta rabiei]|uniref:uncharacterized protein n=1 Tax=Didymella rabiei TaxID=5454 RepID=UPI00220F6613|nr:uncharacterized protein EKO05_0010024 [Ascochyta rabiei]UPX19773.1 hypothetical protein EKO05_0010024 [Ascochyta rabiei]
MPFTLCVISVFINNISSSVHHASPCATARTQCTSYLRLLLAVTLGRCQMSALCLYLTVSTFNLYFLCWESARTALLRHCQALYPQSRKPALLLPWFPAHERDSAFMQSTPIEVPALQTLTTTFPIILAVQSHAKLVHLAIILPSRA